MRAVMCLIWCGKVLIFCIYIIYYSYNIKDVTNNSNEIGGRYLFTAKMKLSWDLTNPDYHFGQVHNAATILLPAYVCYYMHCVCRSLLVFIPDKILLLHLLNGFYHLIYTLKA